MHSCSPVFKLPDLVEFDDNNVLFIVRTLKCMQRGKADPFTVNVSLMSSGNGVGPKALMWLQAPPKICTQVCYSNDVT